MSAYPTSATERAALRDRIGEVGRLRAIAMTLSLKCEGVRVQAQHAGVLGGCRNLGDRCLCECHDEGSAR